MPDNLSQPQSPSVTIIIPAYNESEVIDEVVSNLRNLYPDYKIIVIDDGSTDNTAEKVDTNKCKLIQHPFNRGYGASWKTGVTNADTDIVIFFDGDGQFDPNDVKRVLDELIEHNCDMVTGCRTQESYTPWTRKPGKALLLRLARFLVHKPIKDLNCGLRAIKRHVLLRYLHLLPDGFSASTTSKLVFLKRGYLVRSVDIVTKKRAGKSSVRIIKDGFSTILLMLRIISLFEPMRIFIPSSLVLLLVSMIYSGYEALILDRGIPVLGATLFTAGVIIFFMGIICDQISAIRLERFEDPFHKDKK